MEADTRSPKVNKKRTKTSLTYDSDTNRSLRDMVTEELLHSKQYILLYVTGDEEYKTLYLGPLSINFVIRHNLKRKWKALETAKRRPSVSQYDPVHRCLHCSFSSNYLLNMKKHHSSAHPEHQLLEKNAKWRSRHNRHKRFSTTNRRSKHKHASGSKATYRKADSSKATNTLDTKVATVGGEHNYSTLTQTNVISNAVDRLCAHTIPHSTHSRNAGSKTTESLNSNVAKGTKTFQEKTNPKSASEVVVSKKISIACEICSEQFDHENLKQMHMKAYHCVDNTYHCPSCNQKVQCDTWKQHQSLHKRDQSAERPYCAMCGKYYKSARNLRDHKLEVHGEGQDYCCPVPNCGRVFKRLRNRNVHLERHQEEKSHLCELCGKGYSIKASLVKHLQAQHPDDVPANKSISSMLAPAMQVIKEYQQMFGNVTPQTGGPMTLQAGGPMILSTGGQMTLETGGPMTLPAGGQMAPQTDGQMTPQTGDQMTLQAGGSITLPPSDQMTPQTDGQMTPQISDQMTLQMGGNEAQYSGTQLNQSTSTSVIPEKIVQENRSLLKTNYVSQTEDSNPAEGLTKRTDSLVKYFAGESQSMDLDLDLEHLHDSHSSMSLSDPSTSRRPKLHRDHHVYSTTVPPELPPPLELPPPPVPLFLSPATACEQSSSNYGFPIQYFPAKQNVENTTVVEYPVEKLSSHYPISEGFQALGQQTSHGDGKIQSQYSSTPRSQLSEDLMEAEYLHIVAPNLQQGTGDTPSASEQILGTSRVLP